MTAGVGLEGPRYAREPRFGGRTRLAANELPHEPPPRVRAALVSETRLNRYGDPTCTALYQALARELRVPAEHLAVGVGSSGLLHRLIALRCLEPDDAVMWATPGFEAIGTFIDQAHAQAQHVELTAGGDTDLAAMLAALTPQTRLIVLVNPHNPTGSVIGRDALLRFLDQIPDDVLVVLDEAYREFCDDPAVPDGVDLAREQWAAGRTNLVIVRTFSKAYGLAGLRAGYAIGPVALARALRDAAVPREMSSAACDAAVAALHEKQSMRDSVRDIAQERARVANEIRRYGYAPIPSQANFLCLPLGPASTAFVEHCASTGVEILLIPGYGVRVTIGHPVDNDTFLRAAFTWTPPDAEHTAEPQGTR